MQAILEALDRGARDHRPPDVILARTIKGKGVSSVEGKEGWHGKAFKKGEEPDRAIAELEKQLVPGADDARTFRGRTKSGRAEAGAGLHASSPRRPTSWATRSPRARRRAPRSPRSATPTRASSRSTPTSRTRRSATSSRRPSPDRFFENFIAEQVMVGAAMGLAARGAIPFPSTFACFLTRAADFIRMAGICAVNVKLAGSHAGVSIGEDGPSQMALEDLAMMRAVPDCAVLYPCDAVSTERLVALMAQHTGLAYMRTSRPKTPVIYDATETFRIGGSKVVRQSDDDAATIVGAGVTVFEALAAADQLQKEGISSRVIDAYSVQPIDADTLREAAKATRAVVTVEDHYAAGGLGDAVAEALAPLGVRVTRLAVREIPRSGQPEELLDRYGISARAHRRGRQATHDQAGCGVAARRLLRVRRRQIQRVEQQRERRVRLGAMLRAQAEQHDPARVHVDRHDRGAAGHQLFAFQPARRDDVRCSDSARRRSSSATMKPFDQAEERAVVVEAVGVGGHAVADRVLACRPRRLRIVPGAKC